MNNKIFIATVAAVLLAGVQQAFAQYPGSGSGQVSEETLQKCVDLGIPSTQCDERAVLPAERKNIAGGGSGTPMIAPEAGQMAVTLGVLGAIFGGISAGFFIKGRRVTA
jgi:hypothetical protein